MAILLLLKIGPYATAAIALGAIGFVAAGLVARMMLRTSQNGNTEGER